jgi:hypothetical protein
LGCCLDVSTELTGSIQPTKSQSVIFVDAESILAGGGAQIAGTSLGSAFSVDSEKLLRERQGISWQVRRQPSVFDERCGHCGEGGGVAGGCLPRGPGCRPVVEAEREETGVDRGSRETRP